MVFTQPVPATYIVPQCVSGYLVPQLPRAQSQNNEQSNVPPRLPQRWGLEFEWDAHLGSGGFAKIFKMKEVISGGMFAVKVMQREFYESRGMEQQLDMEIEAMRKCSSTGRTNHVVKLLDDVEENGLVFLRLELCTSSLEEHASQQPGCRLPEHECAHWATQLCFGLQELHSLSIVHRDIKPSNLLLSIDGKLKIIDFGWCAYIGDLPRSKGALAGTFHFMAPEILEARTQTEAVDMWSTGATLLELLTGQPLISLDSTGLSTNCPLQVQKVKAAKVLADIRQKCPLSDSSRPSYLSQQCWMFCQALLMPQASGRMSLLSALSHPWVQQWMPHSISRTILASAADVVDTEQSQRIIQRPRAARSGFASEDVLLRSQKKGCQLSGAATSPIPVPIAVQNKSGMLQQISSPSVIHTKGPTKQAQVLNASTTKASSLTLRCNGGYRERSIPSSPAMVGRIASSRWIAPTSNLLSATPRSATRSTTPLPATRSATPLPVRATGGVDTTEMHALLRTLVSSSSRSKSPTIVQQPSRRVLKASPPTVSPLMPRTVSPLRRNESPVRAAAWGDSEETETTISIAESLDIGVEGAFAAANSTESAEEPHIRALGDQLDQEFGKSRREQGKQGCREQLLSEFQTVGIPGRTKQFGQDWEMRFKASKSSDKEVRMSASQFTFADRNGRDEDGESEMWTGEDDEDVVVKDVGPEVREIVEEPAVSGAQQLTQESEESTMLNDKPFLVLALACGVANNKAQIEVSDLNGNRITSVPVHPESIFSIAKWGVIKAIEDVRQGKTIPRFLLKDGTVIEDKHDKTKVGNLFGHPSSSTAAACLCVRMKGGCNCGVCQCSACRRVRSE